MDHEDSYALGVLKFKSDPRGIGPPGGILRRRSARRNSIGQAQEFGKKGRFSKVLKGNM